MAKSRDFPTPAEILAAAYTVQAKRMEREGRLQVHLAEQEAMNPGARQELLNALNEHAEQVGGDGW